MNYQYHFLNQMKNHTNQNGVHSKSGIVKLKKIKNKNLKCGICSDDGLCLSNPNHKDYKFDKDDGLTYLDCMVCIKIKNLGKRK